MKNEATGLTERETARRAYDIARGFVRNFDSSFENLFLYGDTGVGKTFLSHCIAHDLLESAHCVMYFSAFDLFNCWQTPNSPEIKQKDRNLYLTAIC